MGLARSVNKAQYERLESRRCWLNAAVRRLGRMKRAARELGCSEGYIRLRLKRAGQSARQVLQGDEARWNTERDR